MKLKVTQQDLYMIKDWSIKEYRQNSIPYSFGEEYIVLCYLKAIETFLKQKDIDLSFEVAPRIVVEPIDE